MTTKSTPTSGGDAALRPDEPAKADGTQPSASPWLLLLYWFAQFAAWTVLTPVVVTVAIQIATPEEKAATVAAPVWGAIADRTMVRIGRRKPWMITGAAFVPAGWARPDGFAPNLLVLGIGWFACQVGSNANQAALNAVMPDAIPEHQWGRMSGLLGLSVPVAMLAGTFLALFGDARWGVGAQCRWRNIRIRHLGEPEVSS